MSDSNQVFSVIDSHRISSRLLESNSEKFGGLLTDSQYAWFAFDAKIVIYSRQLGSEVSSRSFNDDQNDSNLKVTFVKELHGCNEECRLLLVGCSFNYFGLLYVCQLPTLTIVRCIEVPSPISYISTIISDPFAESLLSHELKMMSTILLVGLDTGAVYAIDLRQNLIEKQLKENEIVNESKPSTLFIIRKNDDFPKMKYNNSYINYHLSMFINENVLDYLKIQCNDKLKLSISCLLYIEEINSVAIGYSTGHFQIWDCKKMRTVYLLKKPDCIMPITHISFLEPSSDPNYLCYLWIIQSDNYKLFKATMIALTYEQKILKPDGCSFYRAFKEKHVKLEMSLEKEAKIGRCISKLSLCNKNRASTGEDEDANREIRLFVMLFEVGQNTNAAPESYMFLFDINQWYKAQMPSIINNLKVSNSYASFVRLPCNVSYLDFNIFEKTLHPFSYNFRNNVKEYYFLSSIYFECDCLLGSQIIKLKHAGVQQEILDQLMSKSWKLLINPSLVFNQCIRTNLKPFFWNKPDNYLNYSLLDQRSFILSILIENKIMPVLNECAEEWKSNTYVCNEATISHLVDCLWNHVMVVKQYADKLCAPLFDFSGTQLDKKYKWILNYCLSQMQCVKYFLEDLHDLYGVHITITNYACRASTLIVITQYFKAITCFLSYGLLPESLAENSTHGILQGDFTSLKQYANKRREEFGCSQLYLIDAIVNHEPKGNKLIEQWLHEGGVATGGMYPPPSIQCLLRIYLNAALSDQVKNFITVYFLIDVCSVREVDVTISKRMCNFAIEFGVENKLLSSLSRVSWLLDHDMFEEGMKIVENNKECFVAKDESWNWFHWTVLELLIFKSEYFWARFYLKLTKIALINIDHHKFYINLQIMNSQYFDALCYIRSRPCNEKQILLGYCFEKCKETNKLGYLIEHISSLEEDIFFSYLKKFEHTEGIAIQILYFLTQGRYLEAIELKKSLERINEFKYNDELTIASILVDGFNKSIPNTMKQFYSYPPLKNMYKKTDVVLKHMNSDSKVFNLIDKRNKNILNVKNSSGKSYFSTNLFIPTNNTLKRSITCSTVHNEKHRKLMNDDLLNNFETDTEIIRSNGKPELDIPNTPLIEKNKIITSINSTISSSTLEMESIKKHNKQVISAKTNETSMFESLLKPSTVSGHGESEPERFVLDENMDAQSFDNHENESCYKIDKGDNLTNTMLKQEDTVFESHVDNHEPTLLDPTLVVGTNEGNYEEIDLMNPCEFNTNKIITKDGNSKISTNLLPTKMYDLVELSDKEEEQNAEISLNEATFKSTSWPCNEVGQSSELFVPNSSVIQTSAVTVVLGVENNHNECIISRSTLIEDNSHMSNIYHSEMLSVEHEYQSINTINFFENFNTNSQGTNKLNKHSSDEIDMIVTNSEDEGSIKSSNEGSIKSFDEGSIISSDEDGIKSFDEGSIKSSNEEGIKSSDEGSIITSDEASIKSSDEGSIKSSDENGIKSSDEGSIITTDEASIKSSDEGSIKSSNEGSLKSSDKGSRKSSNVSYESDYNELEVCFPSGSKAQEKTIDEYDNAIEKKDRPSLNQNDEKDAVRNVEHLNITSHKTKKNVNYLEQLNYSEENEIDLEQPNVNLAENREKSVKYFDVRNMLNNIIETSLPENKQNEEITHQDEESEFLMNIDNLLESKETISTNQSLNVSNSSENINIKVTKTPTKLQQPLVSCVEKTLRRSSRAKIEQPLRYRDIEEIVSSKSKPLSKQKLNKNKIPKKKKDYQTKRNLSSAIKVVTTRSKAKPKNLISQLNTSSSNNFDSAKKIDENNKQIRVLSKKKSVCHGNMASKKNKSRHFKSSVPVETEVVSKPRNSNNSVVKVDYSTTNRKFKSTVLSGKPTKSKGRSSSSNLHQEAQVKTQKRYNSVRPDITLVSSAVKSKSKKNLSVNLISANKNPNKKYEFMDIEKKKIQKRSLPEPVNNRKKQKLTKPLKQDESESDSSLSNQNMKTSASYFSYEQYSSPIPGKKHTTCTPPKELKKMINVIPLRNCYVQLESINHALNSKNQTSVFSSIAKERREKIKTFVEISSSDDTEIIDSPPKITKSARKKCDMNKSFMSRHKEK